jgi:hypothetical protein
MDFEKNHKNILQEFCQKIPIPLPKYKTTRVNNVDHCPLWSSALSFTFSFSDPLTFTGDNRNKKVDAEMSVAKLTLEYFCAHLFKDLPDINYLIGNRHPIISNKPLIDEGGDMGKNSTSIIKSNTSLNPINLSSMKKEKSFIGLNGKTVLIVDVENLPKLLLSITTKIPDLDIYAFVGEHHCLFDAKYHEGIKKIFSPSTRPDGTDTCIQVYVGTFLAKEAYEYYLIATRDHFGSALVEMISSYNLGWTPKPAKLVTKLADIY